MLVKNNWISSNIKYKLIDKKSLFKVKIKPYRFISNNFSEAVTEAILDIKKYNNLYLGLSGGIDSEFIARSFIKDKVNFTPIIGVSTFNKNEVKYAYAICKELDIKPVIIYISEQDILNCFYNKIIKIFNGSGIHTIVNIILSNYVIKEKGIFVSGHNIIGGNKNNKSFLGIGEYEFYSDLVFNETFELPFFFYTPYLTFEMVKAVGYQNELNTKYSLYSTHVDRLFRKEKLEYSYEPSSLIFKFLLQYNKRYKTNVGLYILDDQPKEFILESLLNFEKETEFC